MDDILRQIHRHTEAPTYRVWKQAWINETQRYVYNVYIVEPSGQALQLNGFIEHADDDSVPRWNASLCGQGTCSRTMLEDHEGFSPDAAGGRGNPRHNKHNGYTDLRVCSLNYLRLTDH